MTLASARTIVFVVLAATFGALVATRAAAQSDPAPTSPETDAGAAPSPDAGSAGVVTGEAAPTPGAIPASASPSPAPAAASPGPEAHDPTLPPIGRPAPPTEAATRTAGYLRPGLELFAEYMFRRTDGPGANAGSFHSFELPRAHAALEGEYQRVRGRVVLEAARSAGEGALIGVAGDAFVLRLREAYAAYRPWDFLDVSAGIVPLLVVPELDGTWMLRAVAPSGVEAAGLAAPTDLGARVRVELPGRYGWAGVAAYNGEGYTSRELNRGKNVEGAVEIHPLPNGALLPLGVFASYTVGSAGTLSARADRLTTGLVWQGERVRAGAFFTYAWGVARFGTQHAALATAFVRVEPVKRLLTGARLDGSIRDIRTGPADAITTFWLTVGYRLADPLEVFLAGSKSFPTNRANAEVPGSDAWTLRVVGRVVF